MANVLNTFKHLTSASSRHAIKAFIQPTTLTSQVRTLYSPLTLGVDSYIQQRARTDSQLGNISEKFRAKMAEYASEESKNMIFTEDLKNMIHLATENDIQLIIRMMTKFNEQNKQLRFGNFVFGPIVMRMFYHLKKPQEALDCFNSPALQGFFDQLMSYQLVMDLLYENKMYTEVLQTFENIQAKQIEGTKYPRNIVVLTTAACYKLNTPDSYKYVLNLWNGLKEAGHFPMRRAATFAGGLALNQNAPEVCMEIVSSTKNQNYTTVRNLKALALTRIGRLDEAINILKSILEQESPVKQTFNKDVVEEIKAAVEKTGNAELLQEMNRIEKYFTEQQHYSDGTLDLQLCEEIKTPPFLSREKQQQYRNQQRFQRYQPRDNRQVRRDDTRFQQRPGLNEMN